MTKSIREFDTGATRDTEEGKLDFEGALSPLVLWAFASYMESHTVMKNGDRRSSDNWQKGFPEDVLMKSLLRHVFDLWMLHRGQEVVRPEDGKVVDWDDALGGCMFNLQALWHGRLQAPSPDPVCDHCGAPVVIADADSIAPGDWRHTHGYWGCEDKPGSFATVNGSEYPE